jgi:hypothetical protein
VSAGRWPAAGLLAGVLVLAACGRTADGTLAATWWIEDAARGVPRRLGELRGVPPDPVATRLADVLAGAPRPAPLAARSARWPRLAGLIAVGAAVVPPGGAPGADRGLLAPGPGAGSEDIALIDAENRDRQVLDAVIVQALGPVGRDWPALVREVRRAADRTAAAGTLTP